MRILHLNTHEHRGGAAAAARMILQGELALGMEAMMLVCEGTGSTPGVEVTGSAWRRRIRGWLDRLPYRLPHPVREGELALQWVPDRLAGRIRAWKPDLVHLHWLYDGYVRLETLAALGVPLVWTLHDEWAFTGGCFYTRDCTRYQDGCGCCPDLHSTSPTDATRSLWRRKERLYPTLPLFTATYSRALVEKAAASRLLQDVPVRFILNAVDTAHFSPGSQSEARMSLQLPPERVILLWSAYDLSTPVKGFALLREALEGLPASVRGRILLVALGEPNGTTPPVGVETCMPGLVRDRDTIRTYYRAADLFLSTSASEVGPQTVMEAMACGCPCVAVGTGGHVDRIRDGETGILVPPGDAAALRHAVAELVGDEATDGRQAVARRGAATECVGAGSLGAGQASARRRTMGEAAVRVARASFAPETQARAYAAYYEEILHPRQR